jgi:ABC-type glycerol-3-phosphate transport system substrate-binding protein
MARYRIVITERYGPDIELEKAELQDAGLDAGVLLRAAAMTLGTGVVAACAAPTQVIEKQVTQIVEKQVTQVVEKVVTAQPAAMSGVIVGKAGQPQWQVPNLAGKELRLWGIQFDPHIDAYNRLAKWFSTYTGARVTVEPQADLSANLLAAMAAGTPPDISALMGKDCGPFVEKKALVTTDEIFPLLKLDPKKWFSPVALQAYQYLGKTWGVPTEGNAVSGYVNVDKGVLKACGKEVEALWPPNQKKDRFDTFEEMWNMAKRMMIVEKDGTVTRWGQCSQGWDNRHLFGIMRTLGRDWWDGDQGKFYLDSPEAIEAMNLQVVKPMFELKIETQYPDNYGAATMAGTNGLGIGNIANPGYLRAQGFVWDTCIFPSAKPGSKALFVGEGGWGFVVPAQSKNRDAGIEFLKWVSTYDGQKEYARIYGGMIAGAPVVNEDPELFPAGDYVGEQVKRCAVAQNDTVYYGDGFGPPSEMEKYTVAAVQNVRTGKMQPKEALQEAQKLCEEMLVRWRNATKA